MKAILVIDMPNACNVCQFGDAFGECNANYSHLKVNLWAAERDKRCPLKPMPEKKSEDYTSDFQALYRAEARGWNACIEELEK